ncbi:hypothetical protein diail_7156 [Diaporthe ilicicola]|nr:hypothetical protein diail_7156 [Diaporthe ilicicola]
MKLLLIFIMGLATLICGILDGASVDDAIRWPNTTASTSVGSIIHLSSGDMITSNKTATAEPSIRTHPANVSVEPIRWSLYSLQAFGNKDTSTSNYAFEAVITPNAHEVLCDESVYSPGGKLDGVDNAECKAPAGLSYSYSDSIPVTVHFAWRCVLNSLGETGYILIVRSNAPGSAHGCPSFPYDACWAEGVYWVPESHVRETDDGDRYVGPESVHINGTYCRTGMKECVWSEYLY